MKKRMVAAGLIVMVALGVSYVFAGGPGSGPRAGGYGPGNGPGNCGSFMGVTDLTPEQQAKLQDLRKKHHEEMAPLREKMFSLRQDLQTLWADPKADPQVIQNKEKEMDTLRSQMREMAVQFKMEARSNLTPEQIASSSGSGCGRGGRGYGRGPF
jgi:Spy/CpxP family protein refolding chaperone